jgi:hypothetical protein
VVPAADESLGELGEDPNTVHAPPRSDFSGETEEPTTSPSSVLIHWTISASERQSLSPTSDLFSSCEVLMPDDNA